MASISTLASETYLPAGSTTVTRPVWLVRPNDVDGLLSTLSADQRAWLMSLGFKGQARRFALLPGPGGAIAGALLGLGEGPDRNPTEPAAALAGLLPGLLPAGDYHLAGAAYNARLAAIAFGLGAYRYRRYKSGEADPLPRLKLADGLNVGEVHAIVEGMAMGRDLINTPSNDMGPGELEAAAKTLATRHGAEFSSIVGGELLRRNFPLIHAVGRASPRAPRLIDINAGRVGAPKVTLVGKGICFDTGGLDLKPSSAMLLMKKDMGGAAAVLALAHMVLSARLDVRLRVLIAAAENSVSGDAFRPGDVIKSRAGKTVEIGNTDAEGRLVLADALSLADEEQPDYLFTFSTLTGAARVALGPDLPPLFCEDDALVRAIEAAGLANADPVWRLPFAASYESWLDSPVADMNNVAEGGFAGAIVAANFMKRFVTKARRFAHFDIYGWRPAPKALGPKGGETQAVRAVYEALRQAHPARPQ
ncbi:MAG: leucyl aminopeptidase family protein [Hyphomicrobiaceae bacterium]